MPIHDDECLTDCLRAVRNPAISDQDIENSMRQQWALSEKELHSSVDSPNGELPFPNQVGE